MDYFHKNLIYKLKSLTKVDQMSNGVKPGLDEDDPANDFVEVDVVIQRQFVSQPHVTEKSHQIPKNEDQADNRVEKYGSS